MLLKILSEEGFDPVVRNHAGDIVIEIDVGRAGDYQHLLVALDCALSYHFAARHTLECIFAEIAAVRLLAVDKQHGILDFLRPAEQGLIEETLASDDVPAVVGIAAALVIAAFSLVV